MHALGSDVADSSPQGVEGSGFCFFQMCLKLCECHFDGVEVGAVWGQEEKPCTLVSEALRRLCALVNGKIVEDDDVALLQGRCKLVST